ncbi:hypothetical protein, partial [Burkholderia aenigmatica]
RKRIYRAIFGSTEPKMARLPDRAKIDTALEDEKSPEGQPAFRAFLRGLREPPAAGSHAARLRPR